MPIAPDRILFEDPWLLAVSKLGGELVVRGKGRLDKLPLFDFLKKQFPSLHVIHRLDFETSGVVVFAKSRAVLQKILETTFAGWKKEYVAIVLGTPKKPAAEIDFRLPARSGDGKVEARTTYHVRETIGPVSVVDLSFERGQRHQIRRHMSMIGHPLILDDVYGIEKANREFSKYLKMHRFFLHASHIEFPHPMTGEKISIDSPLPKSFAGVLKKMKDALA